ncbi:MAG: hypothetical protein H2045_05900 [Rhizobiales bacterium]|nr:hypothetical protein [Hyphomicrobiales bacterium]
MVADGEGGAAAGWDGEPIAGCGRPWKRSVVMPPAIEAAGNGVATMRVRLDGVSTAAA